MKKISTNENVKTGMIWGCLWDETLQWFIDTEAKTQAEVGVSSSSWGNYYSTTFEYISASGHTLTKEVNYSTIIPTGSAERNKANNIYDMAGNVSDCTMENYSSYFKCGRGSASGFNIGKVSERRATSVDSVVSAGFRSILCIQ